MSYLIALFKDFLSPISIKNTDPKLNLEEQKSKFLPGLCNGTMVGALGMSEPGAGSDAIGSMAMRAVRDGDNYILNGTKLWITNGPVADVVLLYAKTAPEKGNQGVSAFLIETKDLPGYSVGKKQNKMVSVLIIMLLFFCSLVS